MVSRVFHPESLRFLFFMVGIYKITSPSGKVYVGQSKNLKQRFANYSRLQNCKNQTVLYRSFLKYGVENHTFEIIEKCEEKELDIKERFWQEQYDVIGTNGLNCVLKEVDGKPRIESENTKIKRSKSVSGLNNPFYGKKHSNNTVEQISITRKNQKIENFYKGKIGQDHSKSKIILDTQTGIFYFGVNEAAFVLKMKANTLSSQLSGKYENKTSLIYC